MFAAQVALTGDGVTVMAAAPGAAASDAMQRLDDDEKMGVVGEIRFFEWDQLPSESDASSSRVTGLGLAAALLVAILL